MEALMEDVRQIGEDLRYVRNAVARSDRDRGPPPVLAYLWAAYVLIGYALIDLNPNAAGMFFAIGGVVGGILSWILGKAYARRSGESDRTQGIRALSHFGGGILLAWVFCIALAVIIAPLRGEKGSQVFVVMIGLIYFLWGVNQDRYYLFLGPILMLGGVLVGMVPHYGWTGLGAVIALGLIAPTFFHSHKTRVPQSQPA
jgi:hypothetical protein